MGLVARVLMVSVAIIFHVRPLLSQLNKIISASIEIEGQYGLQFDMLALCQYIFGTL